MTGIFGRFQGGAYCGSEDACSLLSNIKRAHPTPSELKCLSFGKKKQQPLRPFLSLLNVPYVLRVLSVMSDENSHEWVISHFSYFCQGSEVVFLVLFFRTISNKANPTISSVLKAVVVIDL